MLIYASSCPLSSGDPEIVPRPPSWRISSDRGDVAWGARRLLEELRARKHRCILCGSLFDTRDIKRGVTNSWNNLKPWQDSTNVTVPFVFISCSYLRWSNFLPFTVCVAPHKAPFYSIMTFHLDISDVFILNVGYIQLNCYNHDMIFTSANSCWRQIIISIRSFSCIQHLFVVFHVVI